MKTTVSIISCCLLLSITYHGLSQTAGDFRSRQTGAWTDVNSWQKFNGSVWANATTYPTSLDGKVTVISGHIITCAANIKVDQATINTGATLNITSGTFTATDGTGVDVDCSGTLAVLPSATLNGTGSLGFAPGSTFNWAGGTIAGSGTITINPGSSFLLNGNDHYLLDTKSIVNSGIWTWTAGTLYFYSSSVVSNSGTLNIYTDSDVYGAGTGIGSFVNKPGGIINKIGSPSEETYFYNISSFVNGGTLNIKSSRLRFYSNYVDSGTTNVSLGSQVNFTSGNAAFAKKSTLAGAGSVNFDGAVTTSYTTAIFVNSIRLSLGTLTLFGSVTMNAGSTFYVEGGTINGAGSVRFASGSTFTWTGGIIGGTGTLTINSGAAFNISYSNHYLSDSRSINNSGVWTWTGGAIYYYNSSSIINNAGTFNINTDDEIYSSNSVTASFNNKPGGTINKTGSPSDETSVSGISLFSNSGTINVNSGRLRFLTNVADTGILNVAAGSNINYSNGISVFSQLSIIKGEGTLNLDGATNTINTSSVAIKTVSIWSGTNTLTLPVIRNDGSIFNLYGGTLITAGSLNFNRGGILNWTGGTIGGSGNITIKSGADFLMSDNYHYLADTKIINNQGTCTWTGGPLYYYNTGCVINNSGTLNIRTDDDVIGSNSSTAAFINKSTGNINKIGSPDNETSFGGFGSFINDGKINVTSGKINIASVTAAFNNVINVNTGTTFRQTGNFAEFNKISPFSGNGNVSLDNGTFQFNSAVSIAINSLSLTGGYLKGDSNFIIKPATIFNWQGGTIGGNGILTVDSGALFNTNGNTHYLSDRRAINNKGTWAWAASLIYFYNGIDPSIHNYGTLNIDTDADITGYQVNAGSFTNHKSGIINKNGNAYDETSINGFTTFDNSGKININSGNLSLNVNGAHSGTYNIAPGSQLRGNINMQFTGSTLTNNGTVTLPELIFSKTAPQTLTGSGTINNLTVNNSSGINLGGAQTINNLLRLNNGTITLNSKNLRIPSPAGVLGGTRESYIVTNGSGSLERGVPNDSSAVFFPVGPSGSFMPVTLRLSRMSKADTFKVRVLPGICSAYDVAGNPAGNPGVGNAVNGTWVISENTPGETNATITAQWNDTNESAGFNRTVSSFGHFAGDGWVVDATNTASGINPYTFTKANVTAFPIFGIFNQLVSCLNKYPTICAGNTITVPYKATGNYNTANKFTAQLSDATGSFAAPVNIGSVTSLVSGNITAKIPPLTTPATGYRIRVISSAPALTGGDNGTNITISSCGKTEQSAPAAADVYLPADNLLHHELLIYPNPNKGTFTISLQFKTTRNGYANIEVINTAGQLIHTDRIPLSGYHANKIISLPSSFTAGIYTLRVVAGKEVYYSKIMCAKGS